MRCGSWTATGVAWAGSLPLLALLVWAGTILRSLEAVIAVGLALLALSGSLHAILGLSGWALPTVFMLRPPAALASGQLVGALAVATAVTVAAALGQLPWLPVRPTTPRLPAPRSGA